MVFGLQTWCPSLYCCFAFYCSHRRRAGSPETVVKESSTICLEKNTEENFNHGCRDCSGPRIVTYLLAAASWQSRSECPSGKRRNRTPCSCACYLPQGYLWGAYTAFLCLLEGGRAATKPRAQPGLGWAGSQTGASAEHRRAEAHSRSILNMGWRSEMEHGLAEMVACG